MSLGADVDVDAAAAGGIALGSGLAESANQLLQGFDVGVGQDGGDQFAFLAVGAADADILLKFPFPPLDIPGAPGAVAVPSGGVGILIGSEVLCGKACCLFPGDVVHLHLDPNGLLLHFLNLSQNLLVHAVFLRFCRCFPFW